MSCVLPFTNVEARTDGTYKETLVTVKSRMHVITVGEKKKQELQVNVNEKIYFGKTGDPVDLQMLKKA